MFRDDPYLQERYRALHDSPMQRTLREQCPFPVGVVFHPRQGHTEQDLREQFRAIRNLGFTQAELVPPSAEGRVTGEEVERIARDEGLLPWTPGMVGRRKPSLTEGYSGIKEGTGADVLPLRDRMRSVAERQAEALRAQAQSRTWPPEAPLWVRCPDILANLSLASQDIEGRAYAVQEAGGLYARLRPVDASEPELRAYVAARLACDLNKGGWSVMEAAGGPPACSGIGGEPVDGPALQRQLLAYLAAGVKGISIRGWNAPGQGLGVGAAALTDLTGKPNDRADAAGTVARSCQEHRVELWNTTDEPRVGILYSWENEATFQELELSGEPGRARWNARPGRARIGLARALIHHSIPFEFVTERDLAAGLADRYRTLYIAHTLCLHQQTVRLLREYAERGGHVILDAPTLLRNEEGQLFDTRKGTDYERLFGFEHAGPRPEPNRPYVIDRLAVSGPTFDVNVTGARTLQNFEGTSRPAILENLVGRGRTTTLTFAATALCAEAGNVGMERLLVQQCLGGEEPSWSVDAPVLVFRRATPHADYFFLLSTGLERPTPPTGEPTDASYKTSSLSALLDMLDERVPEPVEVPPEAVEVQGPLIRIAHTIIQQAVLDSAEEIHLEPRFNQLRVLYRVKGALKDVMQLPLNVYEPLVRRYKIMADLKPWVVHQPQDGRIGINFRDQNYDLLLNTHPGVCGERVVMRVVTLTDPELQNPGAFHLTLTVRDRRYVREEDCLTGEPVEVEGNIARLHLLPDGGRWIRLVKG